MGCSTINYRVFNLGDVFSSRNGYSKKTLKTSFGEAEIKVPRDRNGEFEPQLVKKNRTSLTGDIVEKILSMYAKGMTTSDIVYAVPRTVVARTLNRTQRWRDIQLDRNRFLQQRFLAAEVIIHLSFEHMLNCSGKNSFNCTLMSNSIPS